MRTFYLLVREKKQSETAQDVTEWKNVCLRALADMFITRTRWYSELDGYYCVSFTASKALAHFFMRRHKLEVGNIVSNGDKYVFLRNKEL